MFISLSVVSGAGIKEGGEPRVHSG